jgi:hypothetical protein
MDRGVKTIGTNGGEVIYWHRDLPPLDAELMEEHIVEATSRRVPGTLVHRSELWDQCYENLMTQACNRLQQEVLRLGGNYAHVRDEFVDTRHDDVTGETWLHGRFTYTLYRRPQSPQSMTSRSKKNAFKNPSQ